MGDVAGAVDESTVTRGVWGEGGVVAVVVVVVVVSTSFVSAASSAAYCFCQPLLPFSEQKASKPTQTSVSDVG